MKGAKSLTNLCKYWIWSYFSDPFILYSVGLHWSESKHTY